MDVTVTAALHLQPFKVFSVLSCVPWTLGKNTVFVHNSLQLFKANTKIGYMISACCSWVKIFLLLEFCGNNTTFLLVHFLPSASLTSASCLRARDDPGSHQTLLGGQGFTPRWQSECMSGGLGLSVQLQVQKCVFICMCVCVCSCKSGVVRTGVCF